MAEFLSDGWLAALDEAARAAPGLARLGVDAPLVVEQRVRRGSGEVVYHLVFEAAGARVAAGPAARPDLVLVTDVETAWALETGAIAASEAASAGRLRVRGGPERLRAVGDALRELDDAFGAVRAATTAPRAEGLDARPQ